MRRAIAAYVSPEFVAFVLATIAVITIVVVGRA